jgi:hypothetical protein
VKLNSAGRGLGTIQHADVIVVISGCEWVGQGTLDILMTRHGVCAALLSPQTPEAAMIGVSPAVASPQ